VARPELALKKKFRRNVEEKLELVTTNNSTVILSWELSPTYDRVSLVCGEQTFSDRAVIHLATSLVRLLGVGKRMGIVDRDLRRLVVECYPPHRKHALFAREYGLD
jgi:hypothetical protein